MPKLDDYALDPELLDGIWWDYETGEPCQGNKPHPEHGCFLVVPHIGSRFDQALTEEQLPFAELLRKKDVDADLLQSTLLKTRAKAVARTILRGWANWEHSDGSPMEWSEEAAITLLTDRRYLSYTNFIERCALSTEAARRREEEKAKGN